MDIVFFFFWFFQFESAENLPDIFANCSDIDLKIT